ncbi:MAG: N-acetylmuramoyl-L-alanine amidase [Alphaproteobacteria bacterium]|nr:N-acetylmuramoyl-L-alanine amidase [Alphaproteobacteria bacterium]
MKNVFQKLRNMLRTLSFLLPFCCLATSEALAYDVSDIRIGQGVGSIRIVFDSSKKFDYKVFLLDGPKRLVVDIYGATVNPRIEKEVTDSDFVENLRVGTKMGDSTRIVFDLKKSSIIKKAFVLPPQSSFDWRFVVDISLASDRQYAQSVGADKAFSSSDTIQDYSDRATATSSYSAPKSSGNKKRIIVLDPGHGGKDPGAIGYSGVYEKNITLAMAKELKALLDRDSRYKVYLTRNRDVFISLRDRVKISRNHDADLFISIHADSARNRNAVGLSVYTLSEVASDKEAEALADRENKADIIAGLNLVEHSKEVSDILINLAQRETMNRSSEFASFMVVEMRKVAKILSNTHRFAGFAVLKAPDVPSVLLEMGYLSNRTEERLLKQPSYRKKLATATKKAIDKYFENMQQASVF